MKDCPPPLKQSTLCSLDPTSVLCQVGDMQRPQVLGQGHAPRTVPGAVWLGSYRGSMGSHLISPVVHHVAVAILSSSGSVTLATTVNEFHT
jgi:hypothetical protein